MNIQGRAFQTEQQVQRPEANMFLEWLQATQ